MHTLYHRYVKQLSSCDQAKSFRNGSPAEHSQRQRSWGSQSSLAAVERVKYECIQQRGVPLVEGSAERCIVSAQFATIKQRLRGKEDNWPIIMTT
jgi:hypothetical protein